MRRSNGGEENRAQVLCMFFLFLVYTSANFIAIVFVGMCVCICVYIYSFSPTYILYFFIILLIMYEKKSLTIFSLTRDRGGSIKENRNGNRSNSLIRLIVQWNLIEQIKHNTCTIANTT